jgi:hypothetical protein
MPHRPAKRGKKSSSPPPATDGDLLRHIRSLGLESVEAYRAWCRRHGFRPGTRKSWQEQREEQRAARRAVAEAAARAELAEHARSLGFRSEEEYRAWCRRHDFGVGPNKTREQRRQERLAVDRERAAASLAAARRRRRRPEETLRALYEGESDPAILADPVMLQVHEAFAAARERPGAALAFLDLLLHLRKHTRLIAVGPVVPALGRTPGNTSVEGLLALALHYEAWLRPVTEWRSDSHNARRQFGQLARHLLTCFAVPNFMDSAWFEGNTARARRHQEWFRHVGMGGNIRTVAGPLSLTKRMAHEFLLAPDDLPVEAALRYGQVIGLGGDERMARAVVATRLAEITEDEPFWLSVLHFFANNSMLDTDCVGPIVDYVHHRRFEADGPLPADDAADPDADALPDGDAGAAPPAPPFSMKGRTVASLLRLVEEWHRQLARETRRRPIAWEPSGIGAFFFREEGGESPRRWTIQEILTDADLREEGREMRHCVASYARSCARGHTSVWSMQVEELRTGARRRVMTISVENVRRTITQARGRCNQLPGARHAASRLNEAPTLLRWWATQEGLFLPKHV